VTSREAVGDDQLIMRLPASGLQVRFLRGARFPYARLGWLMLFSGEALALVVTSA
jgi:hypothetical protein